MKNVSLNNTQQTKMTEDELFEGLLPNGKYSHLRIILTNKRNNHHQFGQKYLLVTPSTFCLVKLIDIDFKDDYIQLCLQDCTNGSSLKISLDINEKKIKFLLLSWNDIRNMVSTENTIRRSKDELLDFNY